MDQTKSSPVLQRADRARDHLANERTFLAWVRTAVAVVVFGFAIGRFSIAIRQLMEIEGRTPRTPGLTVWLGLASILAGVALLFIGLSRYQRTKNQIDNRTFRPAGFIVNLVAAIIAVLGLAMAAYLVYTESVLN
jgi:putative membrane protein